MLSRLLRDTTLRARALPYHKSRVCLALRRGLSLSREHNKIPLPAHIFDTDRDVALHSRHGVRHAVLTREKAFHALNSGMIDDLTTILSGAERDQACKAVLLTSTGHKAFCAGGDVKALYYSREKQDGVNQSFFRHEYALNYLISQYNGFYVPLMDGATMGGGVGISVHSRYRVATPNTLFAMPETAIGFFPDVGGTYFLSRLEGELGTYLGLTGARLKGLDVLHSGIATHFMDADLFYEFGETLSQGSQRGLEGFENALDAAHGVGMIDLGNDDHQDISLRPRMPVINACFQYSRMEDIVTALQRTASDASLEADRTFAEKTIGTLERMSPMALKVTLEAIRRGANQSLRQCLQREFVMTQQFMNGPCQDFYAGVDAVLISKHGNPQWTHNALSDISDQEVLAYFQLPEGTEPLDLQQVDDRFMHALRSPKW